MTDGLIGRWVRRVSKRADPPPRWHLVESIVSDDAITKCGKRMEPRKGYGEGQPLEVHPDRPNTFVTCQRCDP